MAQREGFVFIKEENRYQCVKEGGHKASLTYKGEKTDSKGYRKNTYRSSEKDCGKCPLRKACCGERTRFKKIDDSIHKELFDKMHQKLQSNPGYARKMSRIRSKTVEPVLGTLLNFLNMRRVNTRGIKQANKHVLLAATCYNLKKYLRFITKHRQTSVKAVKLATGRHAGIDFYAFQRLSNLIIAIRRNGFRMAFCFT
ncbi:MAG: transposase [Bacteroidetes bacterium]|nr:transposase [Bacteroidota bacterium]